MKIHSLAVALLVAALAPVGASAQATVDKTKVKPPTTGQAQDTNNRPAPIQVTPVPPPAAGGRPAQLVQPQLDDLEKRVLALEALVEKQKALVASLSSTVNILQQDNTGLWAKAIAFDLIAKDQQAHWKEYQTHQHNPGTNLGMTKQGNFMMVFTTAPDTLNNRTSGPLPGK